MDVIKVFHGSLTIEDKTSGAGNVRFSSSDTDISLSSSSIMSSSSSVSLFSFDGAEAAPMPTQNCAFTASSSSGIKCNSQEDLIFAKPIMDSHKKQSEIDHSILKSFPSMVENNLTIPATHFESITDNKIKNANRDDFQESLGYLHEPVEEIVIQAIDTDYESYISTDASDCIIGQSKLSNVDNPILKMNLKNLSQCDQLQKRFQAGEQEGSSLVDCDHSSDCHTIKHEEDSQAHDSSNSISAKCQERDNPENPSDPFTACPDIQNEGSAAELSENMETEPQIVQESGSSQLFDQSKKEKPSSHQSKQGCHVHFPSDDQLITGYVFPDVPWKNPNDCSTEELIAAYLESCSKYDTTPSEIILSQLRDITDFNVRKGTFSLKGVPIDWKVCETLEMIFKRVQFNTINLESTGLTEQTAMVMFDLLNYYEPCTKLVLSSNNQIGIRGWQACSSYLRQSQMLKCLEARHSAIPEYSLSPVFRGIQMCANLTSVHLQSSVNPGRSLQLLASGLRNSKSIQDVYLGDNRFNPSDGLQLANLIKDNPSLQLIDLRNNNLQDAGATYIFEALSQSSNCNLNTLIVWNNKLTKGSMSMLSKMLKTTKSLETINLGHNSITDEGVYRLKEGLIKNSSLLRIGLQAIKVTCEGVVALAEFIVEHSRLQKLDLRGNQLKTAGLMALSQSLKVNKSVTCVAMDAEEEDAEKIENEENQEDTKKQYIQDILSYTVRNSDMKQWQDDLADPVNFAELNESGLLQETIKTSQLCIKAYDQVDESKPLFDHEAKSNFQKRCQTLESPSILSPDVALFPLVGRSHNSSEKPSLLAKDALSSSLFKMAAPLNSSKAPSSSDAGGSLAALQASDDADSSGIRVKSPPGDYLPASQVPPAQSAPPASGPPCPAPKPHISKRKFTVSKAILPSIFSKSLAGQQQQQPSVLFTASSDVGHDGTGVADRPEGHGDAKVRIIGIQSEEQEEGAALSEEAPAAGTSGSEMVATSPP